MFLIVIIVGVLIAMVMFAVTKAIWKPVVWLVILATIYSVVTYDPAQRPGGQQAAPIHHPHGD